jgi:hypothetical protein
MINATVSIESLEVVQKEVDTLRKLFGNYRTGQEFVGIAQSLYSNRAEGKVKDIGLCFNRLEAKFSAMMDQARASVTPPVPTEVPATLGAETTVPLAKAGDQQDVPTPGTELPPGA